MSLHRFIYFPLLVLTLFLSSNVNAGLYGFENINEFENSEIPKRLSPPKYIINYRQKMRDNINLLSNYAKLNKPEFVIVLHGAEELLKIDETENDIAEYNLVRAKYGKNKELPPHYDYSSTSSLINNISAISMSKPLCEKENVATESDFRNIYIEKCVGKKNIDDAIAKSISDKSLLYIFSNFDEAFQSVKDEIIIDENSKNIFTINDAKNISILTDDAKYKDKYSMIEDIRNTNYDVIIVNPLFQNKIRYSKAEIDSLKTKKNGTKRLILSQMSLSEVSESNYFWKKDWKLENPKWIKRVSFLDEKSFITEYWNEDWKKSISNYFKSILDIGFDGVWLKGAENYKYFEKLTPLN